jgi:hypothetical protein
VSSPQASLVSIQGVPLVVLPKVYPGLLVVE